MSGTRRLLIKTKWTNNWALSLPFNFNYPLEKCRDGALTVEIRGEFGE